MRRWGSPIIFLYSEFGNFNEGIEEIELGIASRRSIGTHINLPFYLVLFAEALAIAGRLEQALDTLDETEAIVNSTQEGLHRPQIFRIKGDILVELDHEGAFDEAMACYQQAFEDAKVQGANHQYC